MDYRKLAKMNEHQLFLGSEIMQICQDMMDELEELCLKLGTDLTRTEIIEITRVRFNTKLSELKLRLPPEPENRGFHDLGEG